MRYFPAYFFAAAIGLASSAPADVVISEIMYHPSSENVAEEFIELHNTGLSAADLSGWQFSSGVAFTFPNGTSIAAGGYLVVAADPATFHAKYPAVANYVASTGWTGRLSNSANKVTLADALGGTRMRCSMPMTAIGRNAAGTTAGLRPSRVDLVKCRGWRRQIARIDQCEFRQQQGQNWAASTAAEGTPGVANSVAATDIAPVIDLAQHFPLVPTSGDMVTVSCRVRDDYGLAPTVLVHFRNDGAGCFNATTMYDDGAHDDALAGDGIFAAQLPAQADGTIVEFYFSVSDGGLARTWPAPARDYTGTLGQTQNCLYQVDDTVYAGAMPLYKMVMRAADKAELTQINRNTPAAPFPTSDQTYSHAKMNATWITVDGTGSDLRYLTGVRNRGHGSRSHLPQSYNVSFRNDDTWKGLTSLNLNTQNTHSQLFGSALVRDAGLTGPDSRQAQVRVNSVDPTGGGSPSFGFYVANEVQNSEFADHHYPLDSSGNIYRRQTDSTAQTREQADFLLSRHRDPGLL